MSARFEHLASGDGAWRHRRLLIAWYASDRGPDSPANMLEASREVIGSHSTGYRQKEICEKIHEDSADFRIPPCHRREKSKKAA